MAQSRKYDHLDELDAAFQRLDVNASMRAVAINVNLECPAGAVISDHGE